jgi:eukaryotic-like serine/threonine-protein kinase
MAPRNTPKSPSASGSRTKLPTSERMASVRKASRPKLSAVDPVAVARNLPEADDPGPLPRPQPLPENLDAARAPSERPAVRSLGSYEIIAPLDVGGTAEVLLGLRQTVEGYCQCVAIKALRAEYKLDAIVRHMFFAEARLGATLVHPNIPHTLDLGEHHGIPYVVSEYLAGKPLHRVLERTVAREHALTLPAILTIGLEVLDALAYVHSACDFDGMPLGIVHHDISPHNVFVTYDGSIKLLDFGIAWISNFEPGATQQGLRGRPAYMAPEVIAGGRVDARADLFSLGVVLWELAAGARLFAGRTREETFANVCRGVVPSIPENAWGSAYATAPAVLTNIFWRALAVAPRERFASALQMRTALAALLVSVRAADKQLDGRAHLHAVMTDLFAEERVAMQALLAERMPTLRQRHVDFPVASPSTPPRKSMYPAPPRY